VGLVDEVVVFARQTCCCWGIEWPRCLEVYLEMLNPGGAWIAVDGYPMW
jgi:hypothetical protein